jgi:hypothetical protein
MIVEGLVREVELLDNAVGVVSERHCEEW